MARYTYLIQRVDTGRRMSTGVITTSATTTELAVELVAQNRAEHSYYTGPRCCWVWPHDPEQALAHLEQAPDGAEQYDL
ncbi:hypothetical protein AB0P45_31975 [Streptomyces niveus]|uniref:hypothetical protein n=1 Tax=Streptomyces niveus TaxID=193462 RepID=UPI003431BAFD